VAGALWDLGVYAVQAQLYIAGQLPTQVAAQSFNTRPELAVTECEEMYQWQLEFPNRMKSEGAAGSNRSENSFHVVAERGKYWHQNPGVCL
jgi:predicted dehydrogenase